VKKAKSSKPATLQSSPKLNGKFSVRVEKLGVVTVNSGTVVIIDPHWLSRQEVIARAVDQVFGSGGRAGQLDIGVVARTGTRWGRYPAFATIVTYDGLEILASLHIAFLHEITMCKSQEEIQAAEDDFRRFIAHQYQ
jgi:hypothetical protein